MTAAVRRTLTALSSAAAILETLPGVEFAVAYGSHARGRASATSDLDLLYAFADEPGSATIARLVTRVLRLHDKNGLALDHEVAHEIKLWSSRAEIQAAFNLAGFTATRGTLPTITPVAEDPGYLNSPVFKGRLILNALTSPHVFLGGDVGAYERVRQAGLEALATLALASAGGKPVFGIDGLVAALLGDPLTGATGKDWLGYEASDGPHLYALLTTHFHHRPPAAITR